MVIICFSYIYIHDNFQIYTIDKYHVLIWLWSGNALGIIFRIFIPKTYEIIHSFIIKSIKNNISSEYIATFQINHCFENFTHEAMFLHIIDKFIKYLYYFTHFFQRNIPK